MSENPPTIEEESLPTEELVQKAEKSAIRKALEAIFVEGMLLILLVIFFFWVFFTTPTRIGEAINFSIENMIETIPIFIVASLLAGWIDAWVDKEKIAQFIEKRNPIVNLFIITCIGMITPGPIIAIFPILVIMVRKEIGSHNLIAYTTGQTLMGPMRIPLELHYLGLNFFIFRVISTIFLGVFSGICAYPIRNWIDKALRESTSMTEFTE